MKDLKGRTIKQVDIRLGPEIVGDFIRKRGAEDRVWTEGYTLAELERAQERFDLTFPPDLTALYLDRRPAEGWDWRSDDEHIREMLDRPFQGLLFDVEQAGLWWPEWGEQPAGADERAEVLRHVLKQAPKLVPLVSHRYIPCEPDESGNPIFSIVQSDVIYYGADLADYFEREFGGRKEVTMPSKRIRFWSDLVDRAYRSPFYQRQRVDPRRR